MTLPPHKIMAPSDDTSLLICSINIHPFLDRTSLFPVGDEAGVLDINNPYPGNYTFWCIPRQIVFNVPCWSSIDQSLGTLGRLLGP